MLHRNDPGGLIVITQPAHSWLAGEIARAWGNERFGSFQPREETCLAAEQHDCGWLDWEKAPALNAGTGLPYSFMDLPPSDHREIWTRGPRLAALQNPYAGLLVSLHGTGLYARYRSGDPDPETARFLETETAHQQELIAALRSQPRYAPHVSPEALERNRRLVAAWDQLSLFFCLLGGPGKRTIANVPAAEGELDLEFGVSPDGLDMNLEPWPFQGGARTFVVAGRRLAGRFDSVDSMRLALAAAPSVDLRFELRPAAG